MGHEEARGEDPSRVSPTERNESRVFRSGSLRSTTTSNIAMRLTTDHERTRRPLIFDSYLAVDPDLVVLELRLGRCRTTIGGSTRRQTRHTKYDTLRSLLLLSLLSRLSREHSFSSLLLAVAARDHGQL